MHSTDPQVNTPQEEEKRRLVQRIAESAEFRSAPRLREFLFFVTERALSNRLDEISEHNIGHEVFRRREDYDPSNDNIVRVSARQLRTKLKEYTEAEGQEDLWVLEIPKGAYVPVFHPRAIPPEVQEPARQAAEQPAPPVETAQRLPDSAAASSGFWKIAALCCALIALGLGTALLYQHGSVPPPGAQRRQAPLTDLLIRPGQQTLVVLADSSLVLMHELTGQLTNADDYASHRYPAVPGAKGPGSLDAALVQRLAARQLTSVADVAFAIRILRMRPDASEQLLVVHARNIGPRNLKENNVILIGGPRSNPWVELFESRLNFRFAFTREGAPASIRNVSPKAGELPLYQIERKQEISTEGFARIALVPNLDKTGRVLLIAGTTSEATEAAGEFFLDPQAAQALAGELGRPAGAGEGFEVLLETKAIGGTAQHSRILAHRLLQ